MTCERCGAQLTRLTIGRPAGRDGDADRADYRCSSCGAGGAEISRDGELIRRVGPTFETAK